ncbi:MAG: hypothetical protein MUO76_07765 [Anaerolineaceae bacterium]|nr:hypothetical protein [Anaerolineaceae bacterium]
MMNLPAYRLIGDVYAEVERRESWCEGSHPLEEIGVVTAATQENRLKGIPEIDMGVLHILEQLKHQFQFIDFETDLSAYKVVILADEIKVDAIFADKLQSYIHRGGSLLVT